MRGQTHRRLGCCAILGLGALLAAPAVRAEEWAAMGRHPRSTARTSRGLLARIDASAVPERFKAGARRNLTAAQNLRPAPRDRSDAVLEPQRGWVTFRGSDKAGPAERYVAVHGRGRKAAVTYQESRVHRDGSLRRFWREVTPIGRGLHLEELHVAKGKRVSGGAEVSAGFKTKAFLVDSAGHRLGVVPDNSRATKLKYQGIGGVERGR